MTKTTTRLPFGKRVFKARKDFGWSQEWLAEKAGTTRRHIIRIEDGSTLKPRADLRQRLTDIFAESPYFKDGNGIDEDDDEESDLPSLDVVLTQLIRRKVEETVRELVSA